ncbi:hypothetical protein FRC18_001652, partial [Serendipita sp. 400]
MSSKSPVWLSVSRNAFADGEGLPSLVGGVLEAQPGSPKKPHYYAQDEIQGLRPLPRHLIQTIFIQASTDSNYTRYSLLNTCKSWRTIALTTPPLWSRIELSDGGSWYSSITLHVLGSGGVIDYEACPTFDIRLECVDSGQLVELIAKAPPERWQSLHLIIGNTGPSANMVYDLFCGRSFPKLRELRIEERRGNSIAMSSDPYEPLYDCISFNTTEEFKTLYINADFLSTASQFGFFGQRVASIGGSAQFIRDALLSSSGSSEWRQASKLGANVAIRKYHYSHIVSLDLHTWDADTIEKLSLPNLLYLRVEHCQLSDCRGFRNVDDCRPAILLPTVIKLTLTSHSLNVLAQVCVGSLENLVVEELKVDKDDGCLPSEKSTSAAITGNSLSSVTPRDVLVVPSSSSMPYNNDIPLWTSPQPIRLVNYRDNPPRTPLRSNWGSNYEIREDEDHFQQSMLPPPPPPPSKPQYEHLFTLQGDKWSCMYIDTAVLSVSLDIVSLVDFLRQSMALRKLVVTVPHNRPAEDIIQWRQELVERLTDRSYVFPLGQKYPQRPFLCCPQLEELTLSMQVPYVEGDWEKDLRQLMAQRGDKQEPSKTQDGFPSGRLRSVVCRWKGYSQKVQSVPSEVSTTRNEACTSGDYMALESESESDPQPIDGSIAVTPSSHSPQASHSELENDMDTPDASDTESSTNQTDSRPPTSASVSEWETASSVGSQDPPETLNWSSSSEYEVVTGTGAVSSPSLASAS